MEEATIILDHSSGTARLKYYHSDDQPAGDDPLFWDRLWKQQAAREHRYQRAQRGVIPWFLRRPVRRWVKPGGRVLEAGCGQAHFTIGMQALGYRAEGVDFAPEVIARLRERFPELSVGVGDVRRLDVPSDTYDAVYSPGVCEHFEEGPEDVLRETYRILKPGGVALVSTPAFNDFRRALARVGYFRGGRRGNFYQYAFSVPEMNRILEELGFEVLEARFHGTIQTLREHTPLLGKVPLGVATKPVSVALDVLPITRNWGHACVWVARKP